MSPEAPRTPGEIVELRESSLLDVIDNVLNKGVVVRGEVMLGVAGVDLVYLRVSAILSAVDRMFPKHPAGAELAVFPGSELDGEVDAGEVDAGDDDAGDVDAWGAP